MRKRLWILPAAVVLVLTALVGASAAEAPYEHHEHEALSVDASLTLHDIVELALAAYPERQVLDARQDQADAWIRHGQSWLMGRPSLIVRYQTDRFGADENLKEHEAGVELPLWSWGGRDAVRTLGESLDSESAAAVTDLRWQVAGLVRAALWEVALAKNERDLAAQTLDMAARLATTVERRQELGDVALRDVLMAQSSHLEYQSVLIDAEAKLFDAERFYRTLTGVSRRPGFDAETLSEVDEISPGHPALTFADSAVHSAEAKVAVANKTTNAGARLLIGTRRERPALGTDFDDSLGMTFSVPFGGAAQRDTVVSAATRVAAQARAARNHQIRQLTLMMHEAAHGLAVVQENIAAAKRRLEIAERHMAMAESAYAQGEIELLDLIRVRETAIAARRHTLQLQIDKNRHTALYNQATGELP